IVGIHRHEMRTLQDLVPLRPALDDIAFRIDHDDAVFPVRIDAKFSVIETHAIFRILTRATRGGRRRHGRITPWQAPDREQDAGPEIIELSGLRTRDFGQFAALQDINAMWA